MIWKSHHLVTAAGVFAVTGNPLAAIIASSSATFPDLWEMESLGMIKHRTFTHWFPIYLVPLIGLLIYLHITGGLWYSLRDLFWFMDHLPMAEFFVVMMLNALVWILIGCLCHIAEDLLTGYVPFKTPSDRRKIHIFFYPGAPKEYFFDILFVCLCFLYRIDDILPVLQHTALR